MRVTHHIAMLPFLAGTMLAGVPVLAADGYTIGISNTVQGNGWREEMICAIKAQARASGKVASLNIAHRNTDAAGQLEDIRNLIGAGVDAIVINPADPSGINPAIKEATDAGIVAVVVDQGETFRGGEEVHAFLRDAGSEFEYTTEQIGARRVDDAHWVVTVRLEGTFPGGVAELDYRFALRDGLVAELVITNHTA